jgi:hypothetical protein
LATRADGGLKDRDLLADISRKLPTRLDAAARCDNLGGMKAEQQLVKSSLEVRMILEKIEPELKTYRSPGHTSSQLFQGINRRPRQTHKNPWHAGF